MINVQPSNPTVQSEVSFTFFVGSPCPVTSQHVIGSEFIFEVRDDEEGICFGAPIPFQLTWEVGMLEAGHYEVTLIDQRSGTHTQAFTVIRGPVASPEPIPTLDFGGMAVLTGLIVLVASLFLKRERARSNASKHPYREKS